MTAATANTHTPQPDVVRYFPLPLFGSIMGLSGLALVWLKAGKVWGLPEAVGGSIAAMASVLFALYLMFFTAKTLRHRQEVAADWRHPVKINFFAAISISFFLLGTAWRDLAPNLGKALWLIGAVGHAALVPVIMSTWIRHTHYQLGHINPAWFIPVVGNVVAPLAGVGYGYPELSWYFFSVGIVFWLVLLAIVVHRLIFVEPLPQRLAPTLVILLAPPSVGMLAWLALNGGVLDAMARVLYYVALFLALVLVSNATTFWRTPFFLSAWAYSFPLAALTVATLSVASLSGNTLLAMLGGALVLVTSAVILWLVVRTVRVAAKKAIFLPE